MEFFGIEIEDNPLNFFLSLFYVLGVCLLCFSLLFISRLTESSFILTGIPFTCSFNEEKCYWIKRGINK